MASLLRARVLCAGSFRYTLHQRLLQRPLGNLSAGPVTAQAQLFEGVGSPMKPIEVQVPQTFLDGEVLVEIELSTICGSDLHTIHGARWMPSPSILGHEAVGRVLAVGEGRPQSLTGKRVTWTIGNACGECRNCTARALPQKCESLSKYGCMELLSTQVMTGREELPRNPISSSGEVAHKRSGMLNGCYSSHILLGAGTHVTVVDGLSAAVAAPANCALATMVNALKGAPQHAEIALVQGAGLLGLYGCALLTERGIKVVCADISPTRLKMAEQFGAWPLHVDLQDSQEEALAKLKSKLREHGRGDVDLAVEVTGAKDAMAQGVEVLAPGGHYSFVGAVHPNSAMDAVTAERLIKQCISIRGVYNYDGTHLDEGVAFLKSTAGKYPFEDLVGKVFPLSELDEAVEMAKTGAHIRVGVTPQGCE